MNEFDVKRIESAVGVPLPGFYRDFLLRFPAELVDTYVYISPMELRFVAHEQINSSADELIEINTDLRRPRSAWLEEGKGWPEQHFVIGQDGLAGFYTIDLASGKSVFYYECETGEITPEQPSLEAFAAKLIADARAWNAEHEPAESCELPPPDENPPASN